MVGTPVTDEAEAKELPLISNGMEEVSRSRVEKKKRKKNIYKVRGMFFFQSMGEGREYSLLR